MRLNTYRPNRPSDGKEPNADGSVRRSEVEAYYQASVEENEVALRLMRQYGPILITRRQLQDRDQILKKMDQAIYETYCGEGGIRFLAQLLENYTANLLPQTTTLEEMFTGGYSSIIKLMVSRLEKLERDLNWLRKDLNADIPPLNDETLLKALDYRDVSPIMKEIREFLRTAAPDQDCAQAKANAEYLYFLARKNLSRARDVEVMSSGPQKPSYALQYLPLLDTMRTVVIGASCGYLNTHYGWEAEEYREALIAYTHRVTGELLAPYSEL